MSKELVIAANRHEIKVAILEDDQLVEVFFQRANEYSLAGSIHKGRVTRVLPGMQSAFVDLGLERDTFLYVSDFSDETRGLRSRIGEPRAWTRRVVAAVATSRNRPPARAVPRAGAESEPLKLRQPASRRDHGGSRACRGGAANRTYRSWRPPRSRWRSRPAFPPPPWPRPWIPGFQVRLLRRVAPAALWRSSARGGARSSFRPSRPGAGSIVPIVASAGATDFSVLPGESLAKYTRSNIQPLDEAEEDEIRDLQETSAAAESESRWPKSPRKPSRSPTTRRSPMRARLSRSASLRLPSRRPRLSQRRLSPKRSSSKNLSRRSTSRRGEAESVRSARVNRWKAPPPMGLRRLRQPSATPPLSAQVREQGGRFPHRMPRRMRRKMRGSGQGESRFSDRTEAAPVAEARRGGGLRIREIGTAKIRIGKVGTSKIRAANLQPPGESAAAVHHRAAEGRSGDHRPDRQRAAGTEGRAHHIAHRAAGPLRGLHADARAHRRLAQDRQRRRASALEAHPANPSRRNPRRLHRAHGRRGQKRRGSRGRHELPFQPLAGHPPEGRKEARAAAAASRSRHRAAHAARPVHRRLQSHLGGQRRAL